MNYTQGNDPRQNCEKPASTWQKFEPANGKKKDKLTVHVDNSPSSPVYFSGLPENYKGGATRDDNKSDHYVCPVEEQEETEEAEEAETSEDK